MKDKPKLVFIGAGYVGLVNGLGMADCGCKVTILDSNKSKVDRLQSGDMVIYERGMEDIMESLKNCHNEPSFLWTEDTESKQKSIEDADYIFITVGTPQTPSGMADLSYVYEVAHMIGECVIPDKTVVVVKSTVPVGTTHEVKHIIDQHIAARSLHGECMAADNPEFLQEGIAFKNFRFPDRVVVGADSDVVVDRMTDLYKYIYGDDCPLRLCNIKTAELVKYASNAMLATRISFSNMIAEFCDKTGANSKQVLTIMGEDTRIGPNFLNPGCGYGGSCFPKDVASLRYQLDSQYCNSSILADVEAVNTISKQKPMRVLFDWMKESPKIKNIAILGAAFKPFTDDIRESPILDSLEMFVGMYSYAGMKSNDVNIRIYDPIEMARVNIQNYIREHISPRKSQNSILVCDKLQDALSDAHAILILAPCDEYYNIADYFKKDTPIKPYLYDARNMFDADMVETLSKTFNYKDFGRNIQ